MKNTQSILATVVAAASPNTTADAQSPAASSGSKPAKNVVLVHGAFANGAGWREVYDELTQRGYRVTIVQNPLTQPKVVASTIERAAKEAALKLARGR